MTPASKFIALPRADKWLLCEACLALALARLLVLTVPFRFVARWLAMAPETAGSDDGRITRICHAVETAARHVPFNAVCLPQAMAAKAMLARRGCGSSFHLGVSLSSPGGMSAHAWLEAGGRIVIGASGMVQITPVARFG